MTEVLIIGPLTTHSGNSTTADRIKQHISSVRGQCFCRHLDSFTSQSDFTQFLESNNIGCVLGIHAVKSARLLRTCPVPYGIILSGTDINGPNKASVDSDSVTEALYQARYVVAFSQTMFYKAVELWPSINKERMWCIPQAVKTYAGCVEEGRKSWRAVHGLATENVMLALVAGLRPVKDPLYLIEAFSEWHRDRNQGTFLVVIGPEIDKEYSEKFRSVVKKSAGVIYTGAMSIEEAHRMIADSFALVNSSVSEGMSTAILEAMDLGVPVIARNIPGNADIIENGRTGFLYDSPQDFIEKLEVLLENISLRDSVVRSARDVVKQRHDCVKEQEEYVKLVSRLVSP